MALALTLTAAGLAVVPPMAEAQTYRLVSADGTVHLTNTPTHPRYRREGLASGVPGRVPSVALAAVVPFSREIVSAAERHGVPEQLIRAVIRVESGYNPRAVSRKGARGLMQLMPDTASILGVRDLFNPRENIDGGVRHLRNLIGRFGSDLRLALAAYNAGEQAVLMYGGVPPYQETRDYVSRVLALVGVAPELPRSTFQVFERNGTIIYTNIPPRGKL
ncbi:MAG TPA: lytic transglycosylase domain-containing protein [Methylomirabilota bacterium]|nr:lytic transglycosylase domain-containing protein [Methylomirabilota bacterium]